MTARAPVVRPLRPEDADAVAALAATLPEWFTPDVPERVRRAVALDGGFAACDTPGPLLAFLTLAHDASDPEVREISWMAVARPHHRGGLGRALVESAVAATAAAGARALVVSTLAATVDYEPYERTRRFYAACGFVPVRTDRAWWGPDCDRVLLRRDIRAGN